MRYKKVETYQFSVPQEFKAYLDFKADLQSSGVRFTEDGGSHYQTIKLITTGNFDKTEEVTNANN
jgi:hypothetical protein